MTFKYYAFVQASPEQQSFYHWTQTNCELIFFLFIPKNIDQTGTVPNGSNSKFKPSTPQHLTAEVVDDSEEAVEGVAEAVVTNANQEQLK